VIVFVADAPAKRAPTICPFSKSDKNPIIQFFQTGCHSTQLLMHWREHNRVYTNGRRKFSVPNRGSFNVANIKNYIPQFLSVSIIVSTPCTFNECLLSNSIRTERKLMPSRRGRLKIPT
jgi:hypothetical protein